MNCRSAARSTTRAITTPACCSRSRAPWAARALSLPDAGALPFVGHDRWHAYELSWLDARGKPIVRTATFTVPADSPNLVESKSLKLYLNSFNATRFDERRRRARAHRGRPVAQAAGAPVDVRFGLPPHGRETKTTCSTSTRSTVAIDDYGPPNAAYLACVGEHRRIALRSALLKSNCPVTGQPDWAEVRIDYRGPRIDSRRPAALPRLLPRPRRIPRAMRRADLHRPARALPPGALSVEARYTRRGGLDINPWRGTPGLSPPVRCARPAPVRP